MDAHYLININAELTEEDKKRIREAAKRPVVFDEDCPELTDQQLAQMREVAIRQREARKKSVISLRLDNESVHIAKSFGDSYTSLLSRILYKALRDPEYIKDCL